MLEDLPAAEGAVRSLLDDPVARPYAGMWLESTGHEVAEVYRYAADAGCCRRWPPPLRRC
ncbi:MAG: hypothetical protein WD794_02465 [Mycobacteriales bacterium]